MPAWPRRCPYRYVRDLDATLPLGATDRSGEMKRPSRGRSRPDWGSEPCVEVGICLSLLHVCIQTDGIGHAAPPCFHQDRSIVRVQAVGGTEGDEFFVRAGAVADIVVASAGLAGPVAPLTFRSHQS